MSAFPSGTDDLEQHLFNIFTFYTTRGNSQDPQHLKMESGNRMEKRYFFAVTNWSLISDGLVPFVEKLMFVTENGMLHA